MINDNLFVDMHIHSTYTDGTESVENICKRAMENNVGVISITDHNIIEGIERILKIASKYGLAAIPGVELDSTYKGRRCHILGYGFNLADVHFSEFANINKLVLENADQDTLERISEYYHIDISSYKDFTYDNKSGGWKLVHFLVNQNVAKDLEDAIQVMKRYKKRVYFPNSEEIIKGIHKAGGIAILAHLGETFKVLDGGNEEVDRYLDELYQFGIDGIECFYPKHKEVLKSV